MSKKIKVSNIQKKLIKKKCPNCKIGRLKAIVDYNETVLVCSKCDLSIDSNGGAIGW